MIFNYIKTNIKIEKGSWRNDLPWIVYINNEPAYLCSTRREARNVKRDLQDIGGEVNNTFQYQPKYDGMKGIVGARGGMIVRGTCPP